MLGLSFWEISTILIVALLVLGPDRIGPMAKKLGDWLRFLRRASSDLRRAVVDPLEEVKRPLGEVQEEVGAAIHSIEAEIARQGEIGVPTGNSQRSRSDASSTREDSAEIEEACPRGIGERPQNQASQKAKDGDLGQSGPEAQRS